MTIKTTMNLKSQVLPLWFLIICSISTVTVSQTESDKNSINDRGTENQPNNRTGIMDKNMATTTKIEDVNDGYDDGKTYPTMSITESISSDGESSEKAQVSTITETSISDTGVSGDGKLMISTQPMSESDSYYSISPGTITEDGTIATTTDSEVTNKTTDLITDSTDISTTNIIITTTTDSITDNANELTDNTELNDSVSVPESGPKLTTVTSDTTIESIATTTDPDLTSDLTDESTIATTSFNNTTTLYTDTLTNDTTTTVTKANVITTVTGPKLTTDPVLSTTELINTTTTDPELNTTTEQINNTANRNPTTSTVRMSTDLEQNTITEPTAVTTAVRVTVPELVDTTTIAKSTGFTTTELMDNSTTVAVPGLDTNMTTKSGI